jgi:hypothetical protein
MSTTPHLQPIDAHVGVGSDGAGGGVVISYATMAAGAAAGATIGALAIKKHRILAGIGGGLVGFVLGAFIDNRRGKTPSA